MDYLRFIDSLHDFNTSAPANKFGRPTSANKTPLVSILAWCLMPNHYHLFVKQNQDNGISLFQKKLGGGYTKYLNKKYDRSGHAFQGKYKYKLVTSDSHFIHLSRYLHLNPTELIRPNCSQPDFLSQYRWSSYLDWIGTKNFPLLLDSKAVHEVRGMSPIEYKTFVDDWRTFGGRWTSGEEKVILAA